MTTRRVAVGTVAWSFVSALALVTTAGPSAPPSKDQCFASFEQGQTLRSQGALGAARAELEVCAHAACPDLTRNDCAKWLTEVDASVPTLTLAVTDRSGRDVVDVRVSIDGRVLVERLDGKAIPVDPGPHKLQISRPGEQPIELDLVVREGEKNRRVVARFGGGSSAGGGGISAVSPAAWVLGGVGVLGLGVFAVVGGLGLADKSDAEQSCGSRCSDDVVDPIRTKFIVADVALSVGLLSLAAGITVGIITGLGSAPPSAALFLRPSGFGDGAELGFSAQF